MILDIVGICNDVELLNILTIFKSLIKLVTIIVPVILVIFVIIDIIKTITSADVDTKKLSKSVSKRVVAAVVVFLVPYIINLAIGIVPTGSFYYLDCYNSAEKSTVINIASNNADNSLNKFKESVDKYINSKSTDDYNEAYKNYEQARQDVKLIPDSGLREYYKSILDCHDDRLKAAKNNGTIKTCY